VTAGDGPSAQVALRKAAAPPPAWAAAVRFSVAPASPTHPQAALRVANASATPLAVHVALGDGRDSTGSTAAVQVRGGASLRARPHPCSPHACAQQTAARFDAHQEPVQLPPRSRVTIPVAVPPDAPATARLTIHPADAADDAVSFVAPIPAAAR